MKLPIFNELNNILKLTLSGDTKGTIPFKTLSKYYSLELNKEIKNCHVWAVFNYILKIELMGISFFHKDN